MKTLRTYVLVSICLLLLASCGSDASEGSSDDVAAVDAPSADASEVSADVDTPDEDTADETDSDEADSGSDAAEDAEVPDVEADSDSSDGAVDAVADVSEDVMNDAEVAEDVENDTPPEDSTGQDSATEVDAAERCVGVECEVGEYCAEGVCLEGCESDDNCALGDTCVDGACTAPACSCVDGDGDGNFATDCADPLCSPRTDCNDDDNSVFPGATEICDNGVDDDCFEGDLACALCPSGTGLYCGGNGVDGDPNLLYYCDEGERTVFFRSVCVEGCQANEPGVNDACNPGVCPFGNGRYCGPFVGQPANMLLNCVAGAYTFDEACENICVVAEPGFNDFCE